ncbi:MAG TPA: class I SAM-dependent methyltransferase [Azonexus sp.]|nr:class I SAM-dependent methyltransferase [Azonexus sp.]
MVIPDSDLAMAPVRRRFSRADAADRWNDMYAAETECLEDENFRIRRDIAVAYVLKTVQPGARVLDLGCGTGPVLCELRRNGIDAVGLDYSEDMLAHARARLAAQALDAGGVEQGDCRNTPWPAASFDIVVCLGVISYIENYDPVLAEIDRLLKPGGTLLISFRNAWNPLFSDPVALARRVFRILLTPLRGPRRERFTIGRYLDFRTVTARLEARGFKYRDFFGIGFGPYRIAGRKLFSERRAIRLSRRLMALCARLSLQRPLRWLTDVSLWVYCKPGPA